MTSPEPGIPAVPLHLMVPGGRRALMLRVISRSLLLFAVIATSLVMWVPLTRLADMADALGVIAFIAIYLWVLSVLFCGLFTADRRPFSSEITRWS